MDQERLIRLLLECSAAMKDHAYEDCSDCQTLVDKVDKVLTQIEEGEDEG